MSKEIIIIGASGHATSVASLAKDCDYSVIAFASNEHSQSQHCGKPVITDEQCREQYPNANYVLAIGSNIIRKKTYDWYCRNIKQATFPTLIHPSTVFASDAKIGEACVIFPLSIIGANTTISSGVIINNGVSIDHDNHIGGFTSFAPKSVTGGNVTVGELSAISIGSTIKNGINIGTNTMVGASSYVHNNLPDNVTAYGVPSRIVRNN